MPDSPAIPSHAILLPLPLTGCYDYRADDVTPGDFVMVPLGKREQIGVVWGPGTGEVSAQRLKSVIAKLDLPPLPAVCRRFVDRVASYTLAPPGGVWIIGHHPGDRDAAANAPAAQDARLPD